MSDAPRPPDRHLDAIQRRLVELDAELQATSQDPATRFATTAWRRRYRRLIAAEHKFAAAIVRRRA